MWFLPNHFFRARVSQNFVRFKNPERSSSSKRSLKRSGAQSQWLPVQDSDCWSVMALSKHSSSICLKKAQKDFGKVGNLENMWQIWPIPSWKPVSILLGVGRIGIPRSSTRKLRFWGHAPQLDIATLHRHPNFPVCSIWGKSLKNNDGTYGTWWHIVFQTGPPPLGVKILYMAQVSKRETKGAGRRVEKITWKLRGIFAASPLAENQWWVL